MDAVASGLTRRASARLEAVGTTGRPTLEASPDEAFPVALLVNAVANEVGLLVPTSRAEELVARRLLARHVRTTAVRPDARASEAPSTSERPSHRRTVGALLALQEALAFRASLATSVTTAHEAGP